MDFSLSEADRRIRDDARRFARAVLAPGAREADEEARFERAHVRAMGAAGLLGGHLPTEFGGQGWTALQWALTQAELGAVDSSWRGFATVQGALCAQLLMNFASDAQKKELLPPILAGEQIIAYALTEPEAGTDAGSLRTEARRDGGGWKLFGEKIWITNGGVADHILVFANADPSAGKKGICCFLVPGDAPGLERRKMPGRDLGHRGADHAHLVFDGLAVTEDDLVGAYGEGFSVAMGALDHGRLGVAAGAVGIQMGCEEACLDFVRTRRQFGRRIGDFQLVQASITEIHTRRSATELLTWSAAWQHDQGMPSTHAVSVAKYAACEAAVASANEAVLLHGGRGYSSVYPVERFLRDAKGLQIYEGTAHIQRIIVARHLIGKDQG